MSSRISTSGMSMVATNAMISQQAALSKLQNQVALGKRVVTPADDPIAAVHILELQRAQSESDQYGKNITLARSRLSLEEQSLKDTGTVLQRVRELTVQASNTGTLTDKDRASIATELSIRLEELTDIGNRKDSNGEYLFGGFSTTTQPYSLDASGTVNYNGDVGNRLVQIGTNQRVADSHSGYDVFNNVTAGNGTFVAGANAANTGSGSISVGSVVNRSAWVPDNYQLTFTDATHYEITDSATPTANVVASGAYVSGSAIAFNGVQVEISGTPAAGDQFSINESGSEDMFTTLGKLITALKTPSESSSGGAQLTTALANSLQQLDQANDHVLSVRAEVGARLSTLDSADSAAADLKVDLQTTLSDLRDLDYASALTELNQKLVGLQAAQASYSKISQLSLFNYI